MQSRIEDSIAAACRLILLPIAKFFLRHGLTHREFSEIAKWAFVRVASEDYGLRNRRTNASRVAVMTGLSRKEVRRMREIADSNFFSQTSSWNRASLVLRVWYSDHRFLDETGAPRPLPFDTGHPSFVGLVKSCAGDLPVGALSRELLRSGCVRQYASGMVTPVSRSYSPANSSSEAIRHFGVALRNLAETLCYNLDSNRDAAPFFERTTWTSELDASKHARFQTLAQQHSKDFVELLDDWISAHEAPEDADPGIVTGVGVYYFRHKSEASPFG